MFSKILQISLLEDFPPKENPGPTLKDNESQLKEDEQPAKVIQESLNFESPSRDRNANIYQPIPFLYSTGFRICVGCNIEIGYGRFLNCTNAVWHPECFRCHVCKQPICDYEFSMSGNYPYHNSFDKDHCHPKCDVCKHFILTNAAGLIEYGAHPFWVQKYYPFLAYDGTPQCCSCERMEPRETRYVALDDGRKLCLECLDSAIMVTNNCQLLYLEI
ncbi:protein DA1-related 1-like [Diospyros lotus]|uniref:protein DA1-related 1-like n=1 Tax=Diospyros lotus TaxID=55363 RepID=UPI00225566FB|nr:protein DA1-related 1-like [Diospyros lotus]